MGQYGIRPKDFWRLTFKEFGLIQSGFVEKFEIKSRESWEQIRWQTFILMQPNVKQGSLRKPMDLITFPWEKPDTKGIDFIKNNQELMDTIFPKEI